MKPLPFFDPQKARGPRDTPDVGTKRAAQSSGPMSVTVLVARIKQALAERFDQPIQVVGEISNFKRHGSGHLYFRLKDANAAIDAVMFKAAAAKLKFRPTDGLEAIASGRVDVYEVRGQLQLYVESLTPKGTGALELAFRQMREKLQGEGLFDPAHKKPIPRFARAIGVVTSPTGAAIRDIRRTIQRRWPGMAVYLLGAPVQGEGAASQVAEAIRLLDVNAPLYGIDTIIVARGGGSIEDLWAFNEETVARAIFAARTPVISGVGHEVDVTICDLVADARAATPTAAAEMAVCDVAELRGHLDALAGRLGRTVRATFETARRALAAVLRSVIYRDPTAAIRTRAQRLDELTHRLRAGMAGLLALRHRRVEPAANRLAALHPARLAEKAGAQVHQLTARLVWALGGRSKRAGETLAALERRLSAIHPRHRVRLARQQVSAAGRQLEAMSYRSVLQRGFSVTRTEAGKILRSADQVRSGLRIETELSDGRIRSTVNESAPVRDGDQDPTQGRGTKRRRPNDDPQQGSLFG